MKLLLLTFAILSLQKSFAGPRVVGNGFVKDQTESSTDNDQKNNTTKSDKIDYSFIDDSRLTQNEWCVVDKITKIDSYKVGMRDFKNDLYLRKIIFLNRGNICLDFQYKENDCAKGEKLEYMNWTKVRYQQFNHTFDGVIIHKIDLTTSGYLIKSFRGQQYLFIQNKTIDYTKNGKTPDYYVFKSCPNQKQNNNQQQGVER